MGTSRHETGSSAPLKTRPRIVTFRVSGEEFETLVKSCKASGARSLSAFARAAVFDKVNLLAAPKLVLTSDLATLGRTLGELDAALQEASRRIGRLLGPADAKKNSFGGEG